MALSCHVLTSLGSATVPIERVVSITRTQPRHMVSWDMQGPEEPGVQNGTVEPGVAKSSFYSSEWVAAGHRLIFRS